MGECVPYGQPLTRKARSFRIEIRIFSVSQACISTEKYPLYSKQLTPDG